VPQIEVGNYPEHVRYARDVASQERAQNRAVLNPNFRAIPPITSVPLVQEIPIGAFPEHFQGPRPELIG